MTSRRTTRLLATITVAALGLGLGACSSSSDEAGGGATTTAGSSAPSAATTPASVSSAATTAATEASSSSAAPTNTNVVYPKSAGPWTLVTAQAIPDGGGGVASYKNSGTAMGDITVNAALKAPLDQLLKNLKITDPKSFGPAKCGTSTLGGGQSVACAGEFRGGTMTMTFVGATVDEVGTLAKAFYDANE